MAFVEGRKRGSAVLGVSNARQRHFDVAWCFFLPPWSCPLCNAVTSLVSKMMLSDAFCSNVDEVEC